MDNSDNISLKELYDKYNNNRDKELERFWKNSTFVWCFLALCFAAFGIILKDYLKIDIDEDSNIYEIVLAIISYIGVVISKIWTWMARSLKSWFEVYEIAIWDMECKSNVFNIDRRFTINNYWTAKNNINRKSPSKIVIMIGHILYILWTFSFALWIFKICDCSFDIHNGIDWFFWCLFIILSALIYICHWKTKSSELRNAEEEMLFNYIKSDLLNDKLGLNVGQNKLPDLYYQVKNNKVTFYPNIEQECAIRKYYPIQPETKGEGVSRELSYQQKDIKTFYNSQNEGRDIDICEISETLKNNSIKISDIKIVDKRLFIYLEKSVYQSNANKIAEIINDFAQKNKIVYIQYKINN